VDPARLGLLGWSKGASTVLAATNQRHPEVRTSPVQASLAIAFYPGCEADLKRGYSAGMPILLFVGEEDDWTDAAPCKTLATAAGESLVEIEIYPGAFHGFDASSLVQLRKDVPNGVNPGQGVPVGGNPSARAVSAKRTEAFVREHWNLP
jgi:dienelactone hydrolase